MNQNNVSIEFTEAELQALREAMATMRSILDPHLKALTPQNRLKLPKMGDGTLPFVEKSIDYAKANGKFLPPYVEMEELEKDWVVFKNLMPLHRDLKQLERNLESTLMMAGSEAFVGSLSFYNSVKYGARMNVADAQVIYEDLRQRFEKSGASSRSVEVEE